MTFTGGSFTVVRTFVDYNGIYYDPTSQTITVYDSTGTLQYTETSPTEDRVGVFHYIVIIPANGPAGTWKVIWTGIHGSVIYPTTLKITNEIESA